MTLRATPAVSAFPRTSSRETGSLNTESRQPTGMSDTDNSLPLGWILLFAVLALGGLVLAVNFVGGSVF